MSMGLPSLSFSAISSFFRMCILSMSVCRYSLSASLSLSVSLFGVGSAGSSEKEHSLLQIVQIKLLLSTQPHTVGLKNTLKNFCHMFRITLILRAP